jgi:hypothetical protein
MAIRYLDGLKLSFNDGVDAGNSIDKDELKSKKQQIELLMKIDSLEERLSDEYQCAIKSVTWRLLKNVDILKGCITALKNGKKQ